MALMGKSARQMRRASSGIERAGIHTGGKGERCIGACQGGRFWCVFYYCVGDGKAKRASRRSPRYRCQRVGERCRAVYLSAFYLYDL